MPPGFGSRIGNESCMDEHTASPRGRPFTHLDALNTMRQQRGPRLLQRQGVLLLGTYFSCSFRCGDCSEIASPRPGPKVRHCVVFSSHFGLIMMTSALSIYSNQRQC